MRKVSAVVTGILLFLMSSQAFSQHAPQAGKAAVIAPYHLAITFYKTTNLIFPYAIKSVDRGSRDVLVQKAKAVENILQIKASKPNFEETNLTVITADGQLYSYVLNYTDSPAVLNIRFAANMDIAKPDAFFPEAGTNEATIQNDAAKIAGEKGNVRGLKDKKYGMRLQLKGTYIRDDVMYYQISLQNQSNIRYDVDQLRFYIRDQKRNKRTATQELELRPLYVYGNPSAVASQSEQVFVFALPKFTVPDKKYLAVQLMEKNGGRHLRLKVYNKTLIRSKMLPSY
ncbi:conjugative transposon protein TraN [Pontibacter saemangeumensis]